MAIYQGLPESLPGVQLSSVYEVQPLLLSTLPRLLPEHDHRRHRGRQPRRGPAYGRRADRDRPAVRPADPGTHSHSDRNAPPEHFRQRQSAPPRPSTPTAATHGHRPHRARPAGRPARVRRTPPTDRQPDAQPVGVAPAGVLIMSDSSRGHRRPPQAARRRTGAADLRRGGDARGLRPGRLQRHRRAVAAVPLRGRRGRARRAARPSGGPLAASRTPIRCCCPAWCVLNGLGLAMIHRIDLINTPPTLGARQQLIWTAIGVIFFILIAVLLRDHRPLHGYTYTFGLIGLDPAAAAAGPRARHRQVRRPDLDPGRPVQLPTGGGGQGAAGHRLRLVPGGEARRAGAGRFPRARHRSAAGPRPRARSSWSGWSACWC